MEEMIHQMRHFSDDAYFDFFISHNSESADEARELYAILKEVYPDSRIFLDCMTDENGKPFFADSLNNAQYMRDALYISKVLIFVAKEQEHTFEGYGNIATEIKDFYDFQKKRFVNNRPDFNIAHFGIFLCKSVDWNHASNLFDRDAHHFSLKRANALSDLKGSIIDMVKRILHDQHRFANDHAPMLYDLSMAFYEKNREFFSIDNYIDPTFLREDEERSGIFGYQELLELAKSNHLLISGENGGIGKTSLLKKIYEHFLLQQDPEAMMVPIFVEASQLCDNSDILLRYVEKALFNDRIDLKRDHSTREMQVLKTAFTQTDPQKSYLFLIDGLNEIPAEDHEQVMEQLAEAAKRYSACRFIYTSRSGLDELSGLLPQSSISCQIRPLNKEFVKTYLAGHGKPMPAADITFYRILSIPMYLKLYCDAPDDQSMSKGALVHSLFKRHWQKADPAQLLMLEHLLPYIAYRMTAAGKFSISEELLSQYVCDFCDKACADKAYYGAFSKSFRSQLATLDEYRQAGGLRFDRYMDRLNEYIVQSCRLLRCSGSNYEFTHQIYRDFLCAYYMKQTFRLFEQSGCGFLFEIWHERNFEKDIREFLGDLFADEGRPCFDTAAGCWNYDCNENSTLVKCLDRLRAEHHPSEKWVVRVIVHLLSYVRNADMTGLDLSGLDLTLSDLKATIMSRQHGDRLYATSFRGAKLNAENLFREANYTHFVAACINEKQIAALDAGGTLTFWDRDMFNSQFIRRLKIPVDNIKKLRFSPDGSFIYAMTYDKILRIDYENGIAVQTLMHSSQPLQNIFIEGGKLLFTTVLNPFNKKPLDDPRQPDEVDFRFITGIAAINKGKDTLIFADTSGYYGMRIFKRTEEGFKEYRFGYTKILEECMLEIEQQLRCWDDYRLFYDDPRNTSPRRMYFINKQNLFSDRSTNFADGINGIYNEIIKQLNRKGVELESSGKEQTLRRIADKYLQQLHTLLKNEPSATQLSGRKLVSVDVSEDGKTFLLSMQVVYEGDGRFLNKTWVLGEFNTETMEFRELLYNARVQNVTAEYHNGEIVSIGYNMLSFYNKNRRLIRMLKTKDLAVGKLIRPVEGNSFYLAAHNYFYELDLQTGNIIRGIPNTEPMNILTTELCYAHDDPETPGFMVLHHKNRNTEDDGLVSFFTMDGRLRRLAREALREVPVIKNTANTFVTSAGNRDYKVSYEKLICYENGIKADEKKSCYKLFIANCDFTGISGSITENEAAKKILNDYSAKTDFVTPAAGGTAGPQKDHAPCGGTLISTLPDAPAYFTASRKIELKPQQTYMVQQRRDPTEQKKALRIAENYQLTQLTVMDFYILNQVKVLTYATADVISRFVRGILPDCTDQQVRGRIHVLHNGLGALNCWVHTVDDELCTEVYTISARYGGPLLSNMLQTFFTVHSPKSKSKSDISKELASYDLVSKLWLKHPGLFLDYRPFTVVDAEENCDARANISAILSTAEAEYFMIAYRRDYTAQEIVDKYLRVKSIADDHRHIYHRISHLCFTSRPQIILHCEDLAQCREVCALTGEQGHTLPYFTYDAFVGEYDYFRFDGDSCFGLNFT